MDIILHITKRDVWERAQALGSYRTDTLESQGFIHCSTRDQVIRVANALFRGQDDLVLLCIDSIAVQAEIRYENLEGGEERFPHVYGPLNANAVVSALDFEPLTDGTFVLPRSPWIDRGAEQGPRKAPRMGKASSRKEFDARLGRQTRHT